MHDSHTKAVETNLKKEISNLRTTIQAHPESARALESVFNRLRHDLHNQVASFHMELYFLDETLKRLRSMAEDGLLEGLLATIGDLETSHGNLYKALEVYRELADTMSLEHPENPGAQGKQI